MIYSMKYALMGFCLQLTLMNAHKAKQLLEHCQTNDLIIYDRGYPSLN